MKDIQEALEGSIAYNNGYTYYVDGETMKVIKVSPDGSKRELPTIEYPSFNLKDQINDA